jgi:hypothetical protein
MKPGGAWLRCYRRGPDLRLEEPSRPAPPGEVNLPHGITTWTEL